MNSDLAIEIGRDALVVLMLVSAPMLLLGMLVGVIMSIFQAATQIHEQTLTFVPKLIVIALIFLVSGSWMMRLMIEFMEYLFKTIAGL